MSSDLSTITATAPPQAPRRWVKVGQSRSTTPREAATEAAEVALAGPEPKLLLVFGPCAYPPDVIAGAVSAAAAAAGSPDVPVIGCSTTGLIGPSAGPPPGGRMVVMGG